MLFILKNESSPQTQLMYLKKLWFRHFLFLNVYFQGYILQCILPYFYIIPSPDTSGTINPALTEMDAVTNFVPKNLIILN